ncbi:hypothetical protein WJX84_006020 [Apatococcus fuscideae]|uniref:Transmembrane protein 230 n=1 Tax=Apatococcus fuscideae TaxID=2026836 RepID=A0AAW1SKX0_9CHLO
MPLLKSILDDRSAAPNTAKAKRRSAAALCLALLIFGSCAFTVIYFQAHLMSHPFLKLFPFMTMIFGMAAVTPLGMFLAHQDEFQDLNPLRPDHYMLLSKKTLSSMIHNNWKVDSKEL